MSETSYIGRAECGCIQAACVDDRCGAGDDWRRDVARSVAAMIRHGLIVEHVSVDEVRNGKWRCDACKNRPEYKEPPGLKLWKCIVECEVIIASETEPEPWDISSALKEEADENCGGFTEHSEVELVTKLEDVPKKWRDSMPRGDHGDKTCEQLLAEIEAARLERAAVSPMPNQMELPI